MSGYDPHVDFFAEKILSILKFVMMFDNHSCKIYQDQDHKMNNQKTIFVRHQDPCRTESCSALPGIFQQHFPHIETKIISDIETLHTESLDPGFLIITPIVSEDSCTSLCRVKKEYPGISILGIACSNTVHLANEGKLLRSIDDFLICPFHKIDALIRLHKIMQNRPRAISRRSDHEYPPLPEFEGFIGNSPCFLEALHKIPPLAKCMTTVLIKGETGTGKELFAKAIHSNGPRSTNPFVPVNCGAIPDHLFENELFGHRKGAFTDASSEQPGLLQEAEGGTLYLDEIDSLSLAAQVKLLRFLQNREFRSLGSSKIQKANVRVLTSTNRNLKQLVNDGIFREDLYYRINFLSVTIPPLQDRKEDIPFLANHFLKQELPHVPPENVRLPSTVIDKLMEYHWPGNVRELEGIIQSAATFCTTDSLHPEDIDLPQVRSYGAPGSTVLRKAKAYAIEQFERAFLTNLLSTHHGNISQAAIAAGKDRRSFQRLLRKHNLDRATFSNHL